MVSNGDDDRGTSGEEDEDEEEAKLIENDEQKVQLECNEGQLDGLTKLVTGINSDHSENLTTDSNLGRLTQLENVVSHTEVELCTMPLKLHHQADSISPQSSPTSGNSDISESGDDEDAEDDSEEDEDEDEDSDADEDDEDDDDDDEYDDEEIDDDDIVDPVGHQPSANSQRLAMNSSGYDCIGTNLNCYDRIENHETTSDDDVSFENEVDESAQLHDNSNSSLLDSERMLEVTRKLVRSTERDPDRDLRKQVLLRTAIRKLPHFMEYNHYSESFDQSFQMHNHTLESNNTSVSCMSPAQYYEHNHLNHQMDPQSKSYYHSVQPNAIQMSTTSLRMLDLNDDTESEQAISSLEPKHHQEHGYHSDLGNRIIQTGLEQQQQEYASHHIYNQHYTSLDAQPSTLINEHNSQEAIHDFNQYESNQDSSGGIIARHSTMENLYQPLESSDMNDDLKAIEQSTAFQSESDYSRVTPDFEVVTSDGLLEKSDINDNMINVPTQQIVNVLTLEKDDTTTIVHRDIIDHSYQKNHDCNQNQTNTTAFYDSNETQQDSIHLAKLEITKSTPLNLDSNERDQVDTIEEPLEEDQSGSEGGSSNSSQSSTTSDDSVNSTSSQSNDSAGDLSGISMLETSLNTSGDHRYNHSHDSGVALFSPRSNKRSSSSIGLDDEMEIDHLTDLTSSNQFNSGGSIPTLNQCKRMRKREIID